MQQIIIKEDGTAVRQSISETPVTLDSVIRAITGAERQGRLTPIRNIHVNREAGRHYCFVDGGGEDKPSYVGMFFRDMLFTSSFTASGEHVTPNFSGGSTLTMEWKAPDWMKLGLFWPVAVNGTNYYQASVPEQMRGPLYMPTTRNRAPIILAVTQNPIRTWRLPLPNIFDDARLCHGQNAYNQPELAGESIVDVCDKVHRDAFCSAPWNADLINADKRERSAIMFRWRITENGFTQDTPDFTYDTIERVMFPVGNQIAELIPNLI